jgi:hypothetical protein
MEPMSRDEAMHMALEFLGVPRERHAAMYAIQDQIKAWEEEHPGQSPWQSEECDSLFMAYGQAAGLTFP